MDLDKVRILPLDPKAGPSLKRFSCGESEIDKWACDKAAKHSEQGRSRIFVACPAGSVTPLGFYALACTNADQKKLSGRDRDIWVTGGPLIFIYYLAVQRSCQSAGVGKMLLVDGLKRAHMVSRHVPFYGIGLRSLNERTTRLYERYGFAVAPDEGRHPLMILPIWSLEDLLGA